MMNVADDVPSRTLVGAFGCVLALGFLLLLYLLIAMWPVKGPLASATSVSSSPAAVTASPGASPLPIATPTLVPALPGQNAGDWNPHASIFGRSFTIPSDMRFLLIVAIAAALGSYVQIATSFTTYLGNGTFRKRWMWWYVLRIPIGVALALLFYFAIRGGFFTTVSGVDVNPFGIAALGGLVGMFSKQASDKLEDVFEELFKSERNRTRADKLVTPPQPTDATVNGTEPSTLDATSPQHQ